MHVVFAKTERAEGMVSEALHQRPTDMKPFLATRARLRSNVLKKGPILQRYYRSNIPPGAKRFGDRSGTRGAEGLVF